jgi:hypothetical protein
MLWSSDAQSTVLLDQRDLIACKLNLRAVYVSTTTQDQCPQITHTIRNTTSLCYTSSGFYGTHQGLLYKQIRSKFRKLFVGSNNSMFTIREVFVNTRVSFRQKLNLSQVQPVTLCITPMSCSREEVQDFLNLLKMHSPVRCSFGINE